MMDRKQCVQFILAVAAVFLPLPAHAAMPGFPEVTDTSFVEANGDRTLQLRVDVPASAKDAFAAFATIDGWKAWAVPFAAGDARVGGVIETAYRLDARAGDRGNIKNQFIAWLPDRMLVFRNVQAPPDFPHPEHFGRVVSVVEFEPLGTASTRIVMSGVGYAPGPEFDALYKMFQGGNAWSLSKLKQRFERGPVDWKTELAPKLDAVKK